MSQEIDASYKMLFSFKEMVADLVRGFFPKGWLQRLKFDTLELMPCAFVADNLSQRHADMLWRVKVDDEWVYLCLLLEFQSSVDPYMAVRMVNYISLAYQRLIRSGAVLDDRRLPPVLPVVLYNGTTRWSAAVSMNALVPALPEDLDEYRLRLSYLLVDQNNHSHAELAEQDNLVAALMRFEQPESREAVIELVDRLNEKLKDNQELRRAFAIVLTRLWSRDSGIALPLSKIQDLRELRMALATHIQQWKNEFRLEGMQEGRLEGLQEGWQEGLQEGRKEGLKEGLKEGRREGLQAGREEGLKEGREEGREKGREEGREEGRKEGEIRVLKRLLTKRFGPLSSQLQETIDAATESQIEIWADRFPMADSLRDIFRG